MEKAKRLISLIPCKICGDKCSGKHYGVRSCEGCKSFFRRSLMKNIRYECLQNNNCLTEITRSTRNKCQACRFKKCLFVGMGKDSVKLGRMSKIAQNEMTREVKAALNESNQTNNSSSSTESNTRNSASPVQKLLIDGLPYQSEVEIEQNVIEAHMKTCTYTIDEVKEMSSKYNNNETSYCNYDKISLLNLCTRKVGVALMHVIEFAKDIRAFSKSPNLQILFLKNASLDILVVRLSRVVNLHNHTALFGDEFVPIRFFAKLDCIALLERLFKIAYFLAKLQLTEEEIALLSCALLINDHNNLSAYSHLKEFRRIVLKKLKERLIKSHAENPDTLLNNVFIQINSLQYLHDSHVEYLETAERDWGGVEVDPLYKETLINDFEEESDLEEESGSSSSQNSTRAASTITLSSPEETNEFLLESGATPSPETFTGPLLNGWIDNSGISPNLCELHTHSTSPNHDALLNNHLAQFSSSRNAPFLPDLSDVVEDVLPSPPLENSAFTYPSDAKMPSYSTQSNCHPETNDSLFSYYS